MIPSHFTIKLLGLSLLLAILSACASTAPQVEDRLVVSDQQKVANLLPMPTKIKALSGSLSLNESSSIRWGGDGAEEVAHYLGSRLRPATGFSFNVLPVGSIQAALNLSIDPNFQSRLGDEGYELIARDGYVLITAAKPAGLFYGCQTLCQLLPTDIDSASVVSDKVWSIPHISIFDRPRFQWRGLMLDTCRHFFDKDDVKRFVDLLARHKMNSFHWHLTEDQGWRLDVPRYPKLAEISSARSETPIPSNRNQGDGRPYGPHFFNPDDIREVVEYAATRFVNVVPEIEMPGHSLAALSAYPELACTDGPFETGTKWGVFEDVYCAGKDGTFEFLQNVLDHVFTLFPGTFVHVGGDECPKARWETCVDCQARMREHGLADEHELQSYFISRMEKYLNAHDKRLIGWDEILEGGLPANATVMSWRGEKGGIAAAKSGHDVVMSPTSHCYFDYYQSKNTDDEPPAIGGYVPLEKVYLYEPVPKELSLAEAKHVLGAQGNLWTEYIPTRNQADYMTYPRASALAERLWSSQSTRDFDQFKGRLVHHAERLSHLGVNYRPIDKK